MNTMSVMDIAWTPDGNDYHALMRSFQEKGLLAAVIPVGGVIGSAVVAVLGRAGVPVFKVPPQAGRATESNQADSALEGIAICGLRHVVLWVIRLLVE